MDASSQGMLVQVPLPPGVQPQGIGVQAAVQALQTGTCVLQPTTVCQVMDTAHKLGFHALDQACKQFICSSMTDESVCHVLAGLMKYDEENNLWPELRRACLDFANDRLFYVVQSGSFRTSCTPECLLALLHHASVTRPEEALKAVAKTWLQVDPGERVRVLQNLCAVQGLPPVPGKAMAAALAEVRGGRQQQLQQQEQQEQQEQQAQHAHGNQRQQQQDQPQTSAHHPHQQQEQPQPRQEQQYNLAVDMQVEYATPKAEEVQQHHLPDSSKRSVGPGLHRVDPQPSWTPLYAAVASSSAHLDSTSPALPLMQSSHLPPRPLSPSHKPAPGTAATSTASLPLPGSGQAQGQAAAPAAPAQTSSTSSDAGPSAAPRSSGRTGALHTPALGVEARADASSGLRLHAHAQQARDYSNCTSEVTGGDVGGTLDQLHPPSALVPSPAVPLLPAHSRQRQLHAGGEARTSSPSQLASLIDQHRLRLRAQSSTGTSLAASQAAAATGAEGATDASQPPTAGLVWRHPPPTVHSLMRDLSEVNVFSHASLQQTHQMQQQQQQDQEAHRAQQQPQRPAAGHQQQSQQQAMGALPAQALSTLHQALLMDPQQFVLGGGTILHSGAQVPQLQQLQSAPATGQQAHASLPLRPMVLQQVMVNNQPMLVLVPSHEGVASSEGTPGGVHPSSMAPMPGAVAYAPSFQAPAAAGAPSGQAMAFSQPQPQGAPATTPQGQSVLSSLVGGPQALMLQMQLLGGGAALQAAPGGPTLADSSTELRAHAVVPTGPMPPQQHQQHQQHQQQVMSASTLASMLASASQAGDRRDSGPSQQQGGGSPPPSGLSGMPFGLSQSAHSQAMLLMQNLQQQQQQAGDVLGAGEALHLSALASAMAAGGSDDRRNRKPPTLKAGRFPKGVCHVNNCGADITALRGYHQRHRICDYHLKVDSVVIDGVAQRFCQQCGEFHPLECFEGLRRSCRDMLARHNERRIKNRAAAATIGTQVANHADAALLLELSAPPIGMFLIPGGAHGAGPSGDPGAGPSAGPSVDAPGTSAPGTS